MTAPDDNATRLAQHQRLVHALLQDPAALPVPPSGRSLSQTAISSLVVAGNQVIKQRKPLRLDFLDFSTLASRHTDCDEELRLNRRTAPQIYIDVQPIGGSLDVLQAGPAAHTHAQRLHALRKWTNSEFEPIVPLLAQRRTAGWVRECHGDLHLGNVVLIDGRPLPFDCLEFNPELRHIDVVADIAFTFMDLERHGLGKLAWRLVNA